MGADAEGRDAFTASRARFAELLEFCDGRQAAGLTHGELEEQLDRRFREVLDQLVADHLDLRAGREAGR